MSALIVLAFSVVGEQRAPSGTLFNTKWKLEGFFNTGSNQLERLNPSNEDRYTLEFIQDSVVVYDDVEYQVCRGNLSNTSFWGLYTVNHANSTIEFEVIIRPTTAADSDDGERFDRALYLSRMFELRNSSLKMYYGDKGDYLQFSRAEQPDITAAASEAIPEILVAGKRLTAGPNPVARSAGAVNFYSESRLVSRTQLKIFNASGRLVRKIQVRDNASAAGQSRSLVGSWDLKDARGKLVPTGTYLVEGMVKTSDGQREQVSIILGVR